MKKVLTLLVAFLLFTARLFAQGEPGNIIYIVDSIPVVDDPEPGNNIVESEVADITVIKNKDTLRLLGYDKADGAVYIFTKAYRSRPEELKRVPSSRQMERKDGAWYYRGTLYSGPFIDYYYSGRRQGEGTFKEGIVDGTRKMYYQNGNLDLERHYVMGVVDGMEKEYYEDGSLKQQGVFRSGKETGLWESYYPNGQVSQRSTYRDGELVDSAFKFYSNGRIKERVAIKEGKVVADPSLSKINQWRSKSQESNKQGDTKAAIKYCTKIIELDSTNADAYFSRGTIKLNEFEFDGALADLDRAVELEPYLAVALANRAFVRIRKYQFANSRTLSKNSGVTVMASKDKVDIPKEEQQKICNDLQKAVFLGDRSEMISEALANYCKEESK